ncbi:MAG: type II toxin-antitoxin system RatA family toxin [Reyranella sp.]|uniref:type II toxin-antitoxin system RatA family toxin n=1 Tax=Reyranella sp. TaxID=1929291 RepID=UPI001AC9B996|nr:type II toxin-antitoxin system RatA family toxin [Reyranella sp.]MBN9090564.1 type II toxin-antitoxin system RatA family toxin [Reyranella sp.]
MAVTRHAERKVVRFAPQQIFDLVADVPRYPEFLPWCTAARVRKKEGPNAEIAELAIGFGPLHEKFVSRVIRKTDDPEGPRIETVGIEGPFRALLSHWLFRPHPNGTEIVFSLEFEFRSLILQHTMRMLFAEAVKRMVAAFEARAVQLYGKVRV